MLLLLLSTVACTFTHMCDGIAGRCKLAAADTNTVAAAVSHPCQCAAVPGYGYPGCDPCLQGSYGTGGQSSCGQCGQGSTTPSSGATSPQACSVCLAGYGGTGCGKCSNDGGKYGSGYGQSCQSCPDGTRTPSDSVATSIASCTCEYIDRAPD